jgi:hypothetical protein
MTSSYWAAGRDRIQRQPKELAGSSPFASAPQLVSLLTHLVTSELDGTGHELNQARIAMDVLGRSARCDATSDSVVRVEAGRLRSRLPTDDLVVPVAQARLLAATIPKARLVLMEGRNNILSEAEPAWARFLQDIDAFMAEYSVLKSVRLGPIYDRCGIGPEVVRTPA